MDSNIKALLVKKFKDADMDLDVGRHWIDETVVVRVSGTVERHEDQWIAPTVSIPLIPTIAFFWDRLGVEKDAAMHVLRDAITEDMRLPGASPLGAVPNQGLSMPLGQKQHPKLTCPSVNTPAGRVMPIS